MSRIQELYLDAEAKIILLEGVEDGKQVSNIESQSSTLYGSKSKDTKKEKIPVEDEYQDGFIRKTFGLFLISVLFHICVVLMSVNDYTMGEDGKVKNGSTRALIK